MRALVLSCLFAAAAGCTNDPMYLQAPMTIEAGMPDPMNMGKPMVGKASLLLPVKTETASDAKAREALSTKLAPVQVPYVKVGDLEIDVEWTITNLDTDPMHSGDALVELNGANEFFSYDPSMIDLAAPDDEDAPPTPGLSGDIPLTIAPGGTLSGLFTEDQVREAAIDLDQITRGNVNPFRATLTVSKNAESFQPMTLPMLDANMKLVQNPVGPPVPRDAFAQMIRIDLVFKPRTHMTLDFNVRVRDQRGIMHDLGLAAATAKPGELTTFMPMAYNPPPPP
jgi:hypothetical protein